MMAKNRNNQRNDWRDEFEHTGQNPVAWQLMSRAHLGAANALRQSLTSEQPPPCGEELRLRLIPVFLLLGYALENLVKGLLVARGKTATWAGSLEDDRIAVLDPGLKHHCLPELCRIAGVKMSTAEKRLLEDLREAIESEKYPVGIRPRSRKKTLGAEPAAEILAALDLIGRIEASLRSVCLDSVLLPCDPRTFGTDDQPFAQFHSQV